MTTGFDGSTYTYDAQNRLLSATKGATTDLFYYDGLNRQIGKKIGTQALYYRVYDGWDLVGEYKTGTTNAIFAYLYGPGGIVKNVVTNNYYYQDASGSTSHVASSTGNLREYYLYDLHGQPTFYKADGTKMSDTAIGVRHLFTGQQWYNEIGLYDLRFRYYSPDIGRFLQADPVGFGGDTANVYRYCGNDPVNLVDPLGLWTFQVGFALSAQIGPTAFSVGVGIAFDGHGNIAFYNDNFGGAGTTPTAAIDLGVGGQHSDADTVYALQGPFSEGTFTAGDEAAASGVVFVGTDAVSNKPVVGGGVFVGLGGGVGGAGGVSTTNVSRGFNIFDLFGPSSTSSPAPASPPGGTSYVDPNICPECATVGRVVVTGQPVPQTINGIVQVGGSNYLNTSVASGTVTVNGTPISNNGVTSGNGITLGTFGYGSAGIGSGVVEIGLGGGGSPLETEVLLRMH